ncbi:MAG: hypothetical protein JSR48_04170 [Verrucomicrobia bacterium]|nr:hypothetical protein [Verrucomicrobiota bacterium]
MFNRQGRPGALINHTDNFVHVARLVRLDLKPLEIDSLAEFHPSDEDGFSTWLSANFTDFVGRGYVPAYCAFHPSQRVVVRENVNGRRLGEPGYLPPLFMEHAKVSSVKEWQVSVISSIEGATPVPDGVVRPSLLVGVPWTAIREHQQRLLTLGVRPRRLEIGSLAMLGSLQRQLIATGGGSAIAVCEVEYSQTRLYVVAKDGVHTLPPLPHGLLSILETGLKEVGAPDVATARRQLEDPNEAIKMHDRRLVRAISRHLKPAIDHFELRTGQRIEWFHCAQLPARLEWLGGTLAASVELETLTIDLESWLTQSQLSINPGEVELNTSWLSTFSVVSTLAPQPLNG